jgi:transcriptional regulator with GAF, ATPase, and Fis domain
MVKDTILFQRETEEGEDKIIGSSRVMHEIYKTIGRVAESDTTVLIQGESGTGKELVARAIHNHGRRKEKPFLAVNCAAIPEALLESELFGYEKGAFSGADSRKIGKFEQSSTGTIFLDEIGDMSLMTQSKILRVLQDQTVERLGGKETIKVDIRVLAATNQNLEKAVQEKRFREDLFLSS